MISFVIPTFNEERALEKTLKSLYNYNGDYEIIVADDNSADATVAIAKKYTDKIAVNKGEKRGIAANRNRGAKIARGDFLVFIDSDVSVPNPNIFFSMAIGIFKQNKNLVALTVFNRVEPSLETMVDKIILGFFNYLFLMLNNFLNFGASSGKFQMVRADAFQRIDGFDENLAAGEDHDFFRRLAAIGKTYSEKVLTIYYSGRRAHIIGWPKLLWLWTRDTISIFLFKRSASKTWHDIR